MQKFLKFLSYSLFLVILALHVAALYLSLYWKYWWLDEVMHFLGGIWLGCVAIWYVTYQRRINFHGNGIFERLMFSVSLAALGGVLWEFSEFILDAYLNTVSGYENFMQPNVQDTISDLVFDLWGGLTAGIILVVFLYKTNAQISNER